MFARTERLLLRPGWSDDAPALTHAIANEKIARNLASLPWPYQQGDAEAYLGTAFGPTHCAFLITLRRDPAGTEIIGGIGLHPAPDAPDGPPEIGYWIAEAHWGKGYATEAARAVIHIARDALKLPQLKSGYFVDNPASGRVLRKLGFKPIGKVVARRSNGRGYDVPCELVSLDFSEADPSALPRTRMPQMQMMQMAA
jgi:RimJ/RimL family protein N-acetyltransferase